MLSEKSWRAEWVILFCAAQFVCLCLGLTSALLLHKAGVAGFRQESDFGNLLFSTLSFQGVSWLLIGLFLRLHQTDWRTAFGWRGPKIRQPLLLAASLLAVFAVVWLLQGWSVVVLEKFGWPAEDQTAVSLLLQSKSWWVTVYFSVFAVVIAPVAEEFIFRGMLFPFVRQLGFPRLAWFGVSALFAFIHMNAPTFVPLFVFALGLTWLYVKTDNLLAPITAHVLFNAINLAMLLWQKGPPHA